MLAAHASIGGVKTFSDRLKHARDLRRLTQKDLARQARVSQSAIASYESGQRQTSRSVRKLAKALKVELEWLELGKGEMEKADKAAGAYALPASGASAAFLMEPGRASASGKARAGLAAAPGWPFAAVPPERYEALAARDRQLLESLVLAFVESCHAQYAAARGKTRR